MPRPTVMKLTEVQRNAINPRRRARKDKVELEDTPTTRLTKAEWIAALLSDRAAPEA